MTDLKLGICCGARPPPAQMFDAARRVDRLG